MDRLPSESYGVRYIGFRGDYVVTKEKWFATEKAMQRWFEKNEDQIVEIIGYSYPERNPLRRRRTPYPTDLLPRRKNPQRISSEDVVLLRVKANRASARIARARTKEEAEKLFLAEKRAWDRYEQAKKALEQEKEFRPNPRYAFGPTGFRPPARWWAKTVSLLKASYRKLPGMSDAEYSKAIARIAGGIWSRYSDSTRRLILRRYEGS